MEYHFSRHLRLVISELEVIQHLNDEQIGQTDTQTDRQTDRQIVRLTDRKTDSYLWFSGASASCSTLVLKERWRPEEMDQRNLIRACSHTSCIIIFRLVQRGVRRGVRGEINVIS